MPRSRPSCDNGHLQQRLPRASPTTGRHHGKAAAKRLGRDPAGHITRWGSSTHKHPPPHPIGTTTKTVGPRSRARSTRLGQEPPLSPTARAGQSQERATSMTPSPARRPSLAGPGSPHRSEKTRLTRLGQAAAQCPGERARKPTTRELEGAQRAESDSSHTTSKRQEGPAVSPETPRGRAECSHDNKPG